MLLDALQLAIGLKDQSKEVDAEVNLLLITASPAQKPFVMFVIGAAPRCGFVIELLNR